MLPMLAPYHCFLEVFSLLTFTVFIFTFSQIPACWCCRLSFCFVWSITWWHKVCTKLELSMQIQIQLFITFIKYHKSLWYILFISNIKGLWKDIACFLFATAIETQKYQNWWIFDAPMFWLPTKLWKWITSQFHSCTTQAHRRMSSLE